MKKKTECKSETPTKLGTKFQIKPNVTEQFQPENFTVVSFFVIWGMLVSQDKVKATEKIGNTYSIVTIWKTSVLLLR